MKKYSSKKIGFTTIELLLVISLVVVITSVTVISYMTINKKQKEKDYNTMVLNIKSAAELYLEQNPIENDTLKENGHISIEVKTLVESGLLNDYYTVNPKTRESVINLCINVSTGELEEYIFSDPNYCGSYMSMTPLIINHFEISSVDVLYKKTIITVDNLGREITNEETTPEEFKNAGVLISGIDGVNKEVVVGDLTEGKHNVIFKYDNKEFIREVEIKKPAYCIIKRTTNSGEEELTKIAYDNMYRLDPPSEIAGYIFEGWFIVGTNPPEKVEILTCENTEIESPEEIILEPQWKPATNTIYKIRYMTQTGEGTYVQNGTERILTGTTDENIILTPEIKKEIETYKYSHASLSTAGEHLTLNEDGSLTENNGHYVTINGDNSSVVYLFYNLDTYKLNLALGTGVSSATVTGCTGSGVTYICPYGGNVKITAVASTGYTVNSTLVSNVPATVANQINGQAFTVSGGLTEITFSASATLNTYKLNLALGTGVSSATVTGCTGSGVTYNCPYGGNVTITAIASTGYTINNTLVSSIPAIVPNRTNGQAFGISNSTVSSITFTASATQNPYRLNLALGTGVSSATVTGCTGSGVTYNCPYGGNVTITAIASTGYTVNSTLVSSIPAIVPNRTNGQAFGISNSTVSSITFTATASINTYVVTYNANGGSPATATKTVTYGGKYVLPTNPTKGCATFAGWWTSAGGGTQVTTSTTVSITSAQTLYAHWTDNPMGGTWGGCTGGYCNGCSAATNSGVQNNTCGGVRSCTPSSSSLACENNGSIDYDYCYDECGWTTCDTTCGGEREVNLGACIPSCDAYMSPTSFSCSSKSISLNQLYAEANMYISSCSLSGCKQACGCKVNYGNRAYANGGTIGTYPCSSWRGWHTLTFTVCTSGGCGYCEVDYVSS